jgi:hypothetical protein
MTATRKRTTTFIEQATRFDKTREADAEDQAPLACPSISLAALQDGAGPLMGWSAGTPGHPLQNSQEGSPSIAALGRATGVAGESGEAGALRRIAQASRRT